MRFYIQAHAHRCTGRKTVGRICCLARSLTSSRLLAALRKGVRLSVIAQELPRHS
jgi:hypothetical protein